MPDTTSAPQQQSPWWANEKTIIRILAIFGILITIAGVGYLVSLVSKFIVFTPLLRIIGATILGSLFLSSAILLAKRQVPIIISGGLLITSGSIYSLVLYSLLYIYSWWPLWLGAVCFAVLVTSHFALARFWHQSITLLMLAAVFGGFSITFSNYAAHELYFPFPPVCVGILLLASSFRKPDFDNAKAFGAAGVLILLHLDINLPFEYFYELCGFITSICIAIFSLWDTTTKRSLFHCYSTTLIIALQVILWLPFQQSWVYISSFVFSIFWLALSYFAPSPLRSETKIISLSFAAFPLLVLYVVEANFRNLWIFYIAFLLVLTWLMRNSRNLAPWGCWLFTSTLASFTFVPYALTQQATILQPFDNFIFAWFFFASLLILYFLWLKSTIISSDHTKVLLAFSIYYCTLSVAIIGKYAGGNAGWYVSHILASSIWLVIGIAFFLAWPKLQRKTQVEFAILYLGAALSKLIILDVEIMPIILYIVELAFFGAAFLATAFIRNSQTSQKTTQSKTVPPAVDESKESTLTTTL